MGWGRRFQAAREILWGHWWLRIALLVWGGISGYDTFSGVLSQIDPRIQLPPLGPLVTGGSNLLPWWGWLLVLQALVMVSVVEYVVRHVQRLESAPASPQASPPVVPQRREPRFDAQDQMDLIDSLSKLVGLSPPIPIVGIEFGSSGQRSLATRLADLFQRAGWETRFNRTPQEPWNSQYPLGVNVQGVNGFLVQQVAEGLTASGLEDVHSDLRKNEVEPTNPNFSAAVATVYILIGEPEGFF